MMNTVTAFVRKHLFAIESYRHGIVVSMVCNIFAKALLFAVTLAIAYFFGAQSKTDIYFYCSTSIMMIAYFITGMNATVLVPESMRLRQQQGEESALSFLNSYFMRYVLISVIIAALLFLIPIQYLAYLTRFDLARVQENQWYIYIAVITLIPATLNIYIIDILTSYKYFSISMIASMLSSIIMLSILFIGWGHTTEHVLYYGMLFGQIAQLILLIVLIKKRLRWHFTLKKSQQGAHVTPNIGYTMVGNVFTLGATYLPLYLFSGLAPGLVTALTYSQQLSTIPVNFIINQFTSVAGIKFNELAAQTNYIDLSRLAVSSVRTLLLIVFPLSACMFLYSAQIIEIIFNRGAFSAEALATCSLLLKYLSLLIPLQAIVLVFARLITSTQKILAGTIFQICCTLFLMGAMIYMVQRYGIAGYPLALLSMLLVNVFTYWLIIPDKLHPMTYRLILYTFSIILLCNAPAICATIPFKAASAGWMPAVQIAAGIPLYAIITAGMSALLWNMLVDAFDKMTTIQEGMNENR